MVKRLLSALEYPQCDSVNVNDKASFRKLVVWLEQTKIKKANSGTFNGLKNIGSSEWNKNFERYKSELHCPKLESEVEQLQWLLGYAVQIEAHKNKDVYLKYAVANIQKTTVPNVIAENPLDKLNFRSNEFVEGINNVAKILKITPNPDPLVTLKAVCILVSTRLTPEAVQDPSKIVVKGTPFPIDNVNFGFDLTDPVHKKAAKVLSLLYIHDLRRLQTSVNELIVAVQNITANPKTDTKLGKVGF